MGGVASSANGLLSKLEPLEVQDHALPGRIGGRGILLAKFGEGRDGLAVAVAHLSLGANSRMAQLAFIAELLSDHPNAMLMGDFNCMADGDAVAVSPYPPATAELRSTHLSQLASGPGDRPHSGQR